MCYFIFIALEVLVFSVHMFSQNRTITKLGAPDRIYTEEDGLISNSCYGLTQDLDGFIWIYSENGISKFDGHTFKNFTTADGLNSNNVWMISVDSMNRKWIHTDEKRLDYILDDKIYEGVVIPNYRLALLVPISKSNLASFEQSREINFIIQDSFYGNKDIPTLKIINQIFPYSILDYFKVRILGIADSVQVIDNNHQKQWTIGTSGEYRTPVYVNNTIQLTRQEGIDIFDRNGKCSTIEFPKNIQSSRGMMDKNKNIWLSTKQNGLFLYYNSNITNHSFNELHKLDFIEKLKFDQVFCYSNSKDEIYLFNQSNRSFSKLISAPNCKFLTKVNNYLLVSRYTMPFIYEFPLTKNRPSLETYLSKETTIESYATQHFYGNLLLTLESHANSIYLINTKHKPWQTKKLYTWNSRPKWMEIDTISKEVYICVNNNIFIMNSTFRVVDTIPIRLENDITNQTIHDIDFKNRTIYIAANDIIYQVAKQFTKKLHEFKNVIGIKNSTHYLISYNNTCCNLYNTKTSENVKIICNQNTAKIIDNKVVDVFYKSDSLYILKRNSLESHFVGAILNTKFQIVLHNPNYKFKYTDHYNQIFISTEDSTKTVQLSCSILDPVQANHTAYRYKLSDFNQWQYPEVNRIYLGELTEGEHQIIIEAYNKLTSETIATKTFECIVSTPWYKSNYFKFLLLITLIAIVVYLTRFFLNKRYKALTVFNEAILENRSLKLKALEAQMNPHLIYNSLGGIQSLVQTQNYNKAEHYIIKFSKLLRMLLDSLRKNEVSLDKELELLSAYLEIEKFRFNDRFKYNLYTDPKLEKESIYIPNMLIQPFVENALNHGLFHRIEGGLLNINIQKSKSDLVVEIVDNGIGVKQAKEKYKTSRLGHESHALNIIQEKIELFKNLKNFHILISTQDLDPTNKDYPGTHVTLTFKNILENE